MTEPRDPGLLWTAVDDDGWGGVVEVDPTVTLPYDRAEYPVVTWHLPILRAAELARALRLLDQIGDVTGAAETNGDYPYGWEHDIAALEKALEHVVESGRAVHSLTGLRLPSAESACQ